MHDAALKRRVFRSHAVRNADAGVFLERFLVAGVTAVLALRAYLTATGYPKIGGNGLHIAHMLWGGIAMLIAIIVLLSFLGSRAQFAAAILGGAGFGLFIDEVGKFVTTDNNYFFQPATAMIYVIFMLLFLTFRLIERRQVLSEQGYLVNAVEVLKDALASNLDEDKRDRALLLLQQSDQQDPVVRALEAALHQVQPAPDPAPRRLTVLARRTRDLYQRIVRERWFSRLLVLFFVVYAAGATFTFVGDIVSSNGLAAGGVRHTTADWGDFLASMLADVLIIAGTIQLLRRRHAPLSAYHWFRRAVLVSLFIGQVFTFYLVQLEALIWVAVDLVALGALDYMIAQEQVRAAPVAGESARLAPSDVVTSLQPS